ncbi:hypothetical protein, partial [Candidatus Phycosocius bacilliformis]|uniref:hypothetical protein n=1 Tax=Candidatus Phycosocius bacilliformis TaxID=1445552 RepID=UPI0010581566
MENFFIKILERPRIGILLLVIVALSIFTIQVALWRGLITDKIDLSSWKNILPMLSIVFFWLIVTMIIDHYIKEHCKAENINKEISQRIELIARYDDNKKMLLVDAMHQNENIILNQGDNQAHINLMI